MKVQDTHMTSDEHRAHMTRANELPLLFTVMAFQFACLMLLAFYGEETNDFAIKAAIFLPLATFIVYIILIKLAYIDRLLYIITVFLASLGVILLQAVKPAAAGKQCLMLLTLPFTLNIGIQVVRRFTGDERIFDILLIPAALSLMVSGKSNWIMTSGSYGLIQPSELMKPVFVVFMAAGFSRSGGMKRNITYLFGMAIVCGILLMQSDMGALFLYFILIVAMFAAGTGKKGLAALAIIVTGLAAVVFLALNSRYGWHTYIDERFAVWKNPWSDQYDGAYQISQGLISIASGGLSGAGLGLSAAGRVAVVQSDYIFAAMSEEFGIVFSLSVIALYAVICAKGMSIAINARNRFHSLIAFGSTLQLVTQALLIILGNLNVIPLTGVTLPFMSSGGSSLISAGLHMGLIMGVSSLNAEDEFDDWMQL